MSRQVLEEPSVMKGLGMKCLSMKCLSRSVPLVALALVAWGSPARPASAQTLDEVLAKHYEARGGLEALRAVDNLVMRGKVSIQGFELDLVTYRKRPASYRTEVDIQGASIVEATNGVEAWGANPLTGSVKPSPMPQEQARYFVSQADFDGHLMNYQRLGAKLELKAKEALGDRQAYRIEITEKDGSQQTVFLDAETFLETKRLSRAFSDGSVIDIETDIEAWVEVAGTQQPARVTVSSAAGPLEMVFNEYNPGASIDPTTFLMPGQQADPSLTLGQIVEKHLAARVVPGTDQIKTLRALGKMTLMGFQVPLEMSFARPSSCRLAADLQGLSMVLAFDGETAWTVSPLQGIPEPEALPEEAEAAIAIFSDFLWGMLADASAKGLGVELAGVSKVDRDETYKLIVKTAAGEVRELYLGGEDFLERKLHLETVFLGRAQAIDALLSDYRAISGLMMPHDIQLVAGGIPQAAVKIESAEVNVDLDPAIFALPKKPEPAPPGDH